MGEGCFGFLLGVLLMGGLIVTVIFTEASEARFTDTYVVSSVNQSDGLCRYKTINQDYDENGNIRYFIFHDTCDLYVIGDTVTLAK